MEKQFKRSRPKNKAMKLKIGRIGKKTFYMSKKGYFIPARANVDKELPHATLKQMNEFGRAAQSGRLLRMAFKPLLKQVKDMSKPTMANRLTAQLLEVMQRDTTHEPGERTVIKGDTKLLVNFDFNLSVNFEQAFPVPCVSSINRETGALKVSIPAFVPEDEMSIPVGATHFQMVAAGAAMDFVGRSDSSELAAGAVIEVDQTKVEAMVLRCTLPGGSTKVLLLVLGVLFFQKVQEQLRPVADGRVNCLRIVAVS